MQPNECSPQKAGFPKSRRLLKGFEFRHARAEGNTVGGRLMVVNVVKTPPDGRTRCGVIVSKRFSKRAVQRNRAKRLMRESFRLLQHRLKEEVWLVLISRKGISGRNQPEVQKELEYLLRKQGVLADK